MLRSDSRGGSGGWVVDFGISEFEGMWIELLYGSDLCVDRTCVWIGGGVRWGEVCGSDLCVDRRWGEVRWGEVRWGVWIGGVKRSTVEGKLTVGLRLARWSDYREGSEVRWARRDPEWAGSVWVVDGWALSFSRSLSLLRVTRKWFEGKMKV